MKKIKLMLVLVICLFIHNVKADMGPPSVITYKAMITNKDGAYCYEDGKKTDVIIPYKTIFEVYYEVDDGYLYVSTYNCNIKSQDISAISHDFDINNKDVEAITPVKAIILAKGGLNMRSGPSTFYDKIITIPQYTVVTLKLHAGTYWYYTEYNGHSGWITGMHGYFGYDGKEVLVSDRELNIYDGNGKTIGKIPPMTEITDYLVLATYYPSEHGYYIIYNGIKGYIDSDVPGVIDGYDNIIYNKVEPEGKIRLLKDIDIYNDYGNVIKKLTKNQELTYDCQRWEKYHLKEYNVFSYLQDGDFEYIVEGKTKVKDRGYIGEGLFGEQKIERITDIQDENINSETSEKIEENVKNETSEKIEENSGMNTSEIIIISLLACIFLSLTILVIIKLINSKKKNNQIKDNIKQEDAYLKALDLTKNNEEKIIDKNEVDGENEKD